MFRHENEIIHFQGDYGTGKTLLLDSVARKVKDEGGNVSVISALDYEWKDRANDAFEYHKKSNDVLDIIFRQRYEGMGIPFSSVADLKKKKGKRRNSKSGNNNNAQH